LFFLILRFFYLGIEVARWDVRAGKGQGCDGPASGMPNLSEDVLDPAPKFLIKTSQVGMLHGKNVLKLNNSFHINLFVSLKFYRYFSFRKEAGS